MVYGVVRMDIEIDIISNGFFDCSLYFYEWKNLKCIGVLIIFFVIVYFCNDCGLFFSLFNRIYLIRKRKKMLFFFVFLVWKYFGKFIEIIYYILCFFLFYDFLLLGDNNEEVYGVLWEGI